MNYKELLKRYKSGEVTEEEKAFIEDEIRKYEALETYVAETMDEELESMEMFEKEEPFARETTKIKKSVDNRLRRVVLKSVLIAVGIWVGVFFVLSPIMDTLYYNPQKVTVGDYENDISFDLKAVTELNLPGMNPSTVYVEEKGFGVFDVTYSYLDTFTLNFYEVKHKIVRGKIVSTRQDPFFNKGAFQNIGYFITQEDVLDEINEDTLVHMKEMNPVSYGSFNVIFEDDLTMDQLMLLSEKYNKIEFQWAAIRTGTGDMQIMEKIGIHLMGSRVGSALLGDEKIREKYPAFSLLDWLVNPVGLEDKEAKIQAVGYEKHYMSLLEYVIDREEEIKIIDRSEGKGEFYQSALEYAKNEGVKTYGVIVYGEMRDMIEFVENENLKLIDLNDALTTRRY